jgi:hypothetical protein
MQEGVLLVLCGAFLDEHGLAEMPLTLTSLGSGHQTTSVVEWVTRDEPTDTCENQATLSALRSVGVYYVLASSRAEFGRCCMKRIVGSQGAVTTLLLFMAVAVITGLYSTFLALALSNDVDQLEARVAALEDGAASQSNSISSFSDNITALAAQLTGLTAPIAPADYGPYVLDATSNSARVSLSLDGLDRVVFEWSLDGRKTAWWVIDPYGNQYVDGYSRIFDTGGSAAFVVPVQGNYSIWFTNADPLSKCLVTLYVRVHQAPYVAEGS